MTRFSYGARLHTIRSAAIQRVQRPGISQWRRAGERPCNLVLHTSRREFCSVDVPSNLTGNLPHESSALGQEALPPRDPRGRGPGGDLCIALSVSVARSRSSASDGELRTVAGIEADDEACDVLALRDIERASRCAYQTFASRLSAWWRAGVVELKQVGARPMISKARLCAVRQEVHA
jgi:hypothetical protein